MDISYDKYMRTTDDYHVKAVQKIFEKLLEKGDIYKGEYKGLYCTPCESFWTPTQLVDGKCPDCGREVKEVSEEAYFFKLSKYADRLLAYYDEHPEFLEPEIRKNEMIKSFFEKGLEDLCVTRTTIDWGIPILSDPKHTVYVWLDALTNYITALGYGQEDDSLFKKYWPCDLHVIGKDIARFHLIYWPIFLMALDLPLPKQIYVHNWINMKDGKMSKSKGNVIYPEDLISRYGLDALKYYLLASMPVSTDGIFTPEDFVERYNSHLCNDLGNLVNRTISMINKYFDGIIPDYKGHINEVDESFENEIDKKIKEAKECVENCEFSQAVATVFSIVSRTNKYIDETEPWTLYKEEKMEALASCMNHLAYAIKTISILIKPFMEETSNNILGQMGLDNNVTFDDLKECKNFDNIKVIEKGEPIFIRLDEQQEIEYIKGLMK